MFGVTGQTLLTATPAEQDEPGMSVLLIEDDHGDAVLVESVLEAVGGFELKWVRSVDEARPFLDKSDCVLLDLGLPGSRGLEALEQTLSLFDSTPVVVLTGLDDESRGAEAVAFGAQDFLVKGNVDGQLLARSIRYAVQRERADESARLLYQADLLRQHNARLERGLLPRVEVTGQGIELSTWYRAGADQALVGGDFYDMVCLSDGAITAMIGDVSGHGPDEAALGVALRAAWRALVLAGVRGEDVLAVLNKMIATERHTHEIYATACMVQVAPGRDSATVWSAGHPPPLRFEGDFEPLVITGGPALGLIETARWGANVVDFDQSWQLLMYTDGIIEGYTQDRSQRLGIDGLGELAKMHVDVPLDSVLQSLVTSAERANGGSLDDDVALLLLKGNRS